MGKCSGGCGLSRPWTRPVPRSLWLPFLPFHLALKPGQDQLRGLDQAVLWGTKEEGQVRQRGVQVRPKQGALEWGTPSQELSRGWRAESRAEPVRVKTGPRMKARTDVSERGETEAPTGEGTADPGVGWGLKWAPSCKAQVNRAEKGQIKAQETDETLAGGSEVKTSLRLRQKGDDREMAMGESDNGAQSPFSQSDLCLSQGGLT